MWGKFEPLLNAQTISAVASAIITVLVAFNAPITTEQRDALLLLVGAIIAIFGLGTVAARNAVTPTEKVADEILAQPSMSLADKSTLIAKIKKG